MATAIKKLLSSSVDGKQILVAATADPGTLIHTAVTGTTSFDEVWLYCYNTSASDVTLTLQWGGNTTADLHTRKILAKGEVESLIVAGKVLQNSQTIRAYASSANVLAVGGFVNQFTN